jgi:hypothetical protein
LSFSVTTADLQVWSLPTAVFAKLAAKMHRIFQTFIDKLVESADAEKLREGMAETAAALDLSCFAYLSVSHHQGSAPQLLSTYPCSIDDALSAKSL